MFPIEVGLSFSVACLLLVISPGPDNLLAVSRGLSQGKIAALISGIASGSGIVFHVFAASLGLTLLIQTSIYAFYAVKIVGALYLLFLGIKVLKSQSLISISRVEKKSYANIFLTGFLSAALNPKPGFFVLAFIPQFTDPARGSVTLQMIVYGMWFAFLTAAGFTLMGFFANQISGWLKSKPRLVAGLNIGAGITFIVSGLSIATLKQKSI